MGNDRGLARVYGITRRIMANSIFNFLSRLDRFERWFNDRFGWFFTNGMKQRKPQRQGDVRGYYTRA